MKRHYDLYLKIFLRNFQTNRALSAVSKKTREQKAPRWEGLREKLREKFFDLLDQFVPGKEPTIRTHIAHE